MNKYIFIIFALFFLVSCSSPEQRSDKASLVGEVIYRNNADHKDVSEMFIVVNENKLKIVHISSTSELYAIEITNIDYCGE